MGAVSIEDVSLSFKSRGGNDVIALNNLSMQIPDKQFAVIVGPSGCGKSSLLDIIAGLKEPYGRPVQARWPGDRWSGCRARHGVPELLAVSLADGSAKMSSSASA